VKKNELAHKLKEFYLLETFQVTYYKAQLSEAKDEYYRKAFEKMVQIESGHADYFAQQLREQGIEPPQVTAPLFKIAGTLLGETVDLTGPYNTCRLGVALEHRAADTYRDFIMKAWVHENLRDTLMDYLLDEEFHTLWMEDYMRHLAPRTKTLKLKKGKLF
jgi:demethoxyubiquinone hydroxylase (CLK1/Coq7/Cat5 family)